MKKFIIISLLSAVLFSSCSENLLELNNPNSLVSTNSWNTQDDVKLGLTGAYHVLYNSFYNSFNAFLISGQSDEFFSQSPDNVLSAFVNLVYGNYDQRWNARGWDYLYQAVFRANQVIIHAEEVEWNNVTEKIDVLAQARALRGMHYYYLTMLWKNVPLVDWISAPQDQAAETPFDELVVFIEADLKFAAENLPESYAGEPGRVNKYFAYAFLGKLYMNSGQWAKAKESFAVVVKSNKFSLVANYMDNFRHDTENNTESIWEIQHLDINTNMGGYFGNSNDGALTQHGCYREKFMSGTPYGWGDYSAYPWLVNMYKDEKDKNGSYDIRLCNNLVYPDLFTDFPGEVVFQTRTEWDSNIWKDPWCRKYTTGYYQSSTKWFTPINTRILRYGEILMSYAECLVEADGASGIPEAARYVDMVRERVNLYPLVQSVHKDCLNSQNAFIDRLRIEREKEICFEYDRFFDLRRWGLGTDAAFTQSVKDRVRKYEVSFTNGKEWLPKPESEVDNNPNLNQNEGY
ncbi:MAG: RagB/SusD family nutrient uptake outer membrane protein [Tannerellaceae bacterium]|jgi:hypothetical protein|nr:RagB/SusD family nutrient uptake outer membrane protein [Tannerellaceae bacterium]